MNDKEMYPSDIIKYLEVENYLRYSCLTTAELIKKVYEFSTFFNSTGRIALLNVEQNECQELVSLLLNLKKSIKCAISEIGQSQTRKIYNFVCSECEEPIEGQSNTNLWSVFQQHNHFEQSYSEFLSGIKQISIEPHSTEREVIPSTSKVSPDKIIHILDIEHMDRIEGCNGSFSPEEEEPLGSNTFRFNFMPLYDQVIEDALYPAKLKALNQYSTCKLPTIQKINPSRASCLLCVCQLRAAKKITKNQCLDHILGQRHARAVVEKSHLTALESYHELFWNSEPCYQAHQVYFEPKNSNTIKCHLCWVNVPIKSVIEHIKSEIHKKTVIDLFFKKRFDEFLLLDLQVQVYGIEQEKTQNDKPKVQSPEKVVRERKAKTEATSDQKQETKEVEHTIFSRPNPCITLQDFIPQRYKEHSKYFKDKGTYIFCELCVRNFNKKLEDVMDHFTMEQHWQSGKIVKPKYKYYCEICNIFYSNEFVWNKHFKSEKNHSKISKSRLHKLTEYECISCKVVFFGDDISVIRHRNSTGRGRKKEAAKEIQLHPEIMKMFQNREFIEKEGDRLVKEANNIINCLNRTLDCCSRIEEVLKTSLTYCKAYPFGSRMSGLGNENSDLDIFIDTGNMYFGGRNQDPLSQIDIVNKVYKVLISHKNLFTKIHQIPTARTPIVKVRYIGTGLDCDLSFRHALSVENTKFLRICLQIQPICQALILVLKKWSSLNKLDEHISTYALAMLAIFYLQVNEYLLSVKELKRLNPMPAAIINGWETINYTMPCNILKNHVKPYEHSLSRLLKDFFLFYATFNYQDTVCPLLGHVISKNLFQDPKQLPPEMSAYVKQLNAKEPEQFRFLSPFCIQDPFDLSHNLTKACQSSTLAFFKKLCDLSYKHLSSLK